MPLRRLRLAAITTLAACLLFVEGYCESVSATKPGDSASMQIVQRLSVKDYLQAIAWSPDGSRLAALTNFGSLITIWDTHSWWKIKEISQFGGTYAGDSLAWTRDGMIVASAGAKVPEDGIYSMNLLNPETGELVKRILGPPVPEGEWKHNQAGKFVLSNDRSLLAMTFVYPRDRMFLFDTYTWTIKRAFDIAAPSSAQMGNVTSFAFSPTNKVIAITNSRDLQTLDLENGSLVFSALAYDGTKLGVGPTVKSLAYSSDGALIAGAPIFFPGVADDTGPVRIWSAKNGALVTKLPTRNNSSRGIAWSPDGAKLATVPDGIVQVLQIEPDIEKSKVIFESGAVLASVVAFSPDGRLAAGGRFSVMIIK